ncbi:DUF3696 domain-containing protein [Acinetobacter guillouiae]|uniref:DUF3696 domain-containing protein n=1 Tax=Acinetobacter guillouiae TaxID=106649 RepID=UPI001AE681FB|nr:DUF3696 domain-containing protein [Acinetobacter guillouiae]MBP2543186.1 putative ATPase [Acinetobacter guillouiae]
MIEHIFLKNFKCFSQQDFKLAPLTVFCGSNSAGKSTAIQAILSAKQNLNNIKNMFFNVDGELFSFGKLKDLLSHNPIDNEVIININDFKLKLITDKLDVKTCLINEETSNFDILFNLFSNDFIYLCAERFGPRSSFEIVNNNEKLDIGIFGQYALSTFSIHQDKPANNQSFAKEICKHLFTSDNNDEVIFTDALVREAMRKVCPSFSMNVIEAGEIDRVYNMYLSGSESIRPINVGFGVSYVLPIIISASLIKPGGILIVENPEVHLHPSAQSNLIKILCELSKTGVQVIIETHSDHIINGIRVFAKESKFNENGVIINSVTVDNHDKRNVKEINIDNDGNLSALDTGFFDQINKDLMRLF